MAYSSHSCTFTCVAEITGCLMMLMVLDNVSSTSSELVIYHEIVFNVLLARDVFKREAFWWHPPYFISSEFGHVTPQLSCTCHLTVIWCCRRRGGFACLCHGWGCGIWIVSGLLLGRLSGTACYRGLQYWCSGSLPCVYYTPCGGQPEMSLFYVLWVSCNLCLVLLTWPTNTLILLPWILLKHFNCFTSDWSHSDLITLFRRVVNYD